MSSIIILAHLLTDLDLIMARKRDGLMPCSLLSAVSAGPAARLCRLGAYANNFWNSGKSKFCAVSKWVRWFNFLMTAVARLDNPASAARVGRWCSRSRLGHVDRISSRVASVLNTRHKNS